MTAKLTYETPKMGTQTVMVSSYHTQPNGVLVAQTDSGGKVVLGAATPWKIDD